MASSQQDWSYKRLDAPQDVALNELPPSPSVEDTPVEDLAKQPFHQRRPIAWIASVTMITALILLLTIFAVAHAGLLDFGKRQATSTSISTEVPQYFQTTPEIYAGRLPTPSVRNLPLEADILYRAYGNWACALLG